MTIPRFTLETEAGIARVTLTHRQRANAVDTFTIRALGQALAVLAHEPGLRALVLTGEGERVFCGGADLGELAGHTATSAAAHAYDNAWDPVTERLARLPCLTVARINGACVGGGLSLALACDLRLAADHSFFQYPALKNNVLPSAADVVRMQRLLGPARTKALWLGGLRVSSAEAREWGLIERAMPLAELDAAVLETLAVAAGADPVVVAGMKRLIDEGHADREQVEWIYRAVYDRDEAAIRRLWGDRP